MELDLVVEGFIVEGFNFLSTAGAGEVGDRDIIFF